MDPQSQELQSPSRASGNRVLDLLGSLGDAIRRLLADYREANKFFKTKIWLIVLYALVCVATLVIFVPPGETNDIDARVTMAKASYIGGHYFLVVNDSGDPWRDIVLTINDRYRLISSEIAPGNKQSFYFNKFIDANGDAADSDIRVQKFSIECSEGVFERDYE